MFARLQQQGDATCHNLYLEYEFCRIYFSKEEGNIIVTIVLAVVLMIYHL